MTKSTASQNCFMKVNCIFDLPVGRGSLLWRPQGLSLTNLSQDEKQKLLPCSHVGDMPLSCVLKYSLRDLLQMLWLPHHWLTEQSKAVAFVCLHHLSTCRIGVVGGT